MPRRKKPILKAPFPYFGGKSKVAELVWERLGDCPNVIEPFAGSLAWLLCRPHAPRIETVNDIDCLVTNFWRATAAEPEQVAHWADHPVHEAHLHAVHRWLVLGPHAEEFRQRMRTDPDYYDAQVAGRWCWGLCCWIGGGWCSYAVESVRRPQLSQIGKGDSRRLKKQVPNLSGSRGAAGRGVVASAGHKKRPSLSDGHRGRGAKGVLGTPRGLNVKRPHIATGTGYGTGVNRNPDEVRLSQAMPSAEMCRTGGKGVNGVGDLAESLKQQLPQIGNARGVLKAKKPNLSGNSHGKGVNTRDAIGSCELRTQWLVNWFRALRDRMRTVRVCSGDWQRVCDSESVTTRLGLTGIFFDPPYALNVARMHAWIKHLLGDGPEPGPAKGVTSRDNQIYGSDAGDVDLLVARVHVYCRERGRDPLMRIALAGYAGEHEGLEELGWECVEWHSHGGYGNRSSKGRANKKRERLWFSPHCLRANPEAQRTLFTDEH